MIYQRGDNEIDLPKVNNSPVVIRNTRLFSANKIYPYFS